MFTCEVTVVFLMFSSAIVAWISSFFALRSLHDKKYKKYNYQNNGKTKQAASQEWRCVIKEATDA